MKILGIETSCDDTSAALVERTDAGFVVHKNTVSSQIDIHKKYGGIVPEVAGRAHADMIIPVIRETISEPPDVIAVTAGPGLITSLVVGVEVAKGLSMGWGDIPIVRTNHIEGHIYSVLLGDSAPKEIVFPALALIVSGGHTELILMRDHGDYKLVGRTRDDAAGECFDKIGKLVGFSYPGGPKISKAAKNGNPKALSLPRPMIGSGDFDFSFAGLKTAARYWLEDNELGKEISTEDFCASVEQTIVDVLIKKTVNAAAVHNVKTIILGGGVSANPKLRDTLLQNFPNTIIPELQYTTDNAAMIAAAGYFHAIKKQFTPWRELTADPGWELVD